MFMRFIRSRIAVGLFAVLSVFMSPTQATNLTDYAENTLIDRMVRGQATPAFPTTWYFALFTTACSDSAAGTEVSGNGYNRATATLAANMTNFAGTQSAASTTASSGTGGQSSNNVAITYNTPSASWGVVTHMGMYDASSGGNMWVCFDIADKTINNGDTVSFAIGAVTVTFN